MGITIASEAEYGKAIRDMFPKGEYWDKQFEDPESDCSLFCKAKTAELIWLRKRMAGLQAESVIQTAEETIEDWERIILNKKNTSLNLQQRRFLLGAFFKKNITINGIKEIGLAYGITVTDVMFPFKPAFFGFSSFGQTRIAGPAAFSLLFINIAQAERSAPFEKEILSNVLSNYIVFFNYGGS